MKYPMTWRPTTILPIVAGASYKSVYDIGMVVEQWIVSIGWENARMAVCFMKTMWVSTYQLGWELYVDVKLL